MSDAANPQDTGTQQDIATLAKGGRTNVLGFLLRLAARLPFFIIAGRLYGVEAVGRFASATLVIDLAGQLCTLGQKRGLAQRLARGKLHAAATIADAMTLSLAIAILASVALYLWPTPMFPSGKFTAIDRLLPLAIAPATLTDIALAALAFRFDVSTTVRARSVVEPWTLSIVAGTLWFVAPASGLSVAFIASIYASALVAVMPLLRAYGLAHWRPHPRRVVRLIRHTLPLAVADTVEWGTRKLDLAILSQFATPTAVGVYWAAQQIASLPQKLKTSFEPILGPVITRKVRERNYPAIARQVSQVGFWITAAQAGIALALGIPGHAVLGLVGPKFTGGSGALGFLLAAEVGAAAAVVSEAALIYIAPLRNLAISLATITLQAVLTLAGMGVATGFRFDQLDRASSAAGALMVTLCIASVVKTRLLSRYLGLPVSNFRWPLLWAAAAAAVVGWAAVNFLPEWAELAVGIPAILGVYCWIIWHKGFGPDDRVLFGKQIGEGGAPELAARSAGRA